MDLSCLPLGDRAIIVNLGDRIDPTVNDLVIALHEQLVNVADAGIDFCTPAFCSLGIGYDPALISYDDLAQLVQQQFKLIQTVGDRARRIIRIPVCYSAELGIDLEQVAANTGMTCDQVIQLHTSKTYRAYMLGFLPGFAYLGRVDPRLRVDRHAEPRLKVAAGSVGLAGEQTGVHPCEAPGGWQIIGRTPVSLYRPNDDRPNDDCSNDSCPSESTKKHQQDQNRFLVSPGDEVQFYPIDPTEYDSLRSQNNAVDKPAQAAADHLSTHAVSLRFKTAGLRTAIQDFGRCGYQHLGVPAGGVMDRFSATIANRLVGNADDAALIEITLMGPAIEISGDCKIAIAGADLSPKLDGQAVAMWETISVVGAQRLSFGRRRSGCRCYLAIAGEFQAPTWLGSASVSPPGADAATGYQALKGRTLQVATNSRADHKRIFPAARRPVGLRDTQGMPAAQSVTVEHRLQVSRGPEWDWFSPAQQAEFLEHRFEILPSSNSMGYRLSSFLGQPHHETLDLPEMISSAVVPGVIQVTPSGQCILLMRDAQTTGGYPRIVVVSYEALNQVAQLCPGDTICFNLAD